MLIAGKRACGRLTNCFFQFDIRFIAYYANAGPQPERQRARRFQLNSILDPCRSTQYDRAFNQFMLFVRKAVSLHVDRFQNMLPYLCQLLMMHGLPLNVLPALFQSALQCIRQKRFQSVRPQRPQLFHAVLKAPLLHRLRRFIRPTAHQYFFLPEHCRSLRGCFSG